MKYLWKHPNSFLCSWIFSLKASTEKKISKKLFFAQKTPLLHYLSKLDTSSSDIFLYVIYTMRNQSFPLGSSINVSLLSKMKMIGILFNRYDVSYLDLVVKNDKSCLILQKMFSLSKHDCVECLYAIFEYLHKEEKNAVLYEGNEVKYHSSDLFEQIHRELNNEPFTNSTWLLNLLLKVNLLYDCTMLRKSEYMKIAKSCLSKKEIPNMGSLEPILIDNFRMYLLNLSDIRSLLADKHCQVSGTFCSFKAILFWKMGSMSSFMESIFLSKDHELIFSCLNGVLESKRSLENDSVSKSLGIVFRPASDDERQNIFTQILQHCEFLASHDCTKLYTIISQTFPHGQQSLLHSLSNNKILLYAYSKNIYLSHNLIESIAEEWHTTFLELMCDFESAAVYSYLKSNSSSFDRQRILSRCKENHLLDAVLLIYECEKEFDNEIQFLIESIYQSFQIIQDSVKYDIMLNSDIPSQNLFRLLEDATSRIFLYLNKSISILQKIENTQVIESNSQKFDLWLLLINCFIDLFKLIESLIPSNEISKYSMIFADLNSAFRNNIISIFYTLMAYPNIFLAMVHKLMNDGNMLEEDLVQILSLVFEANKSSRIFSSKILQSIRNEVVDLMHNRIYLQRRGLLINASDEPYHLSILNYGKYQKSEDKESLLTCGYCNQHLKYIGTKAKFEDSIVLFEICGHIMHERCIKSLNISSTENQCPLCMN
jgi:hypothetical protein